MTRNAQDILQRAIQHPSEPVKEEFTRELVRTNEEMKEQIHVLLIEVEGLLKNLKEMGFWGSE